MYRRQAFFTKGWTKPVETEMPGYGIKSPGIGINFRTPIYYETKKSRNSTFSLEKKLTNPGVPSYMVASTPTLDPPSVIERDQMTKAQRDDMIPEPTVTAKDIVQSGSGFREATPPPNLIVRSTRAASLILDTKEKERAASFADGLEEGQGAAAAAASSAVTSEDKKKRQTKNERKILSKKQKVSFGNFKIE